MKKQQAVSEGRFVCLASISHTSLPRNESGTANLAARARSGQEHQRGRSDDTETVDSSVMAAGRQEGVSVITLNHSNRSNHSNRYLQL